ncbi:MAG: hypothetical protein WD023_07700 [Ilumatobacteraceae bacterium]
MATRTATNHTTAPRPEQLTLLLTSDKPVQFRLDRRTRERGLAHIAAIRRQLAQQADHRSWGHGKAA